MAYQTMMASSARETAADMANAGPPLAAGRNARGRTASLKGSASGGSYRWNGWPQTSQLFRGSHARCTNVPHRSQTFPSLESTMWCSQTLHLLPAICMGRISNAPAQAGRASDVRLPTERRSRPCLKSDGSAMLSWMRGPTACEPPSPPTQDQRGPGRQHSKHDPGYLKPGKLPLRHQTGDFGRLTSGGHLPRSRKREHGDNCESCGRHPHQNDLRFGHSLLRGRTTTISGGSQPPLTHELQVS